MSDTPTVKYPDVTVNLSALDGNVFALIAAVSRALKQAGHHEAVKPFQTEAMACQSYDAVLQLIMRTVETS